MSLLLFTSPTPQQTHSHTTEFHQHLRHHNLIVVYLFLTIHDNVGREVIMERDHLS